MTSPLPSSAASPAASTPRRTARARALVVPLVVLLAVVLLAGCSDDADDEPAAAPRTPRSAPPPPAPPKNDACYRIGFEGATRPATASDPVPCAGPHTSRTFFVGRLDTVADGHLVAVDSAKVTQQLSRECPRRLTGYLGGDQETQRLSRFEAVWFTPTLAQAERGAAWYRCDVVALAGNDKLLRLPKQVRGFLDRDDALDRYGTCGTAAPDKPAFQRVACQLEHTWRAAATVDLPKGAKYGGKKAGDAADAACRDVAAEASGDALEFTWSFEWPSRQAFADGQRWGTCWLPDKG